MFSIEYSEEALIGIAKLRKSEPSCLCILTAYGHYGDK